MWWLLFDVEVVRVVDCMQYALDEITAKKWNVWHSFGFFVQ